MCYLIFAEILFPKIMMHQHAVDEIAEVLAM